jgi:simple sugar transport system permease protein
VRLRSSAEYVAIPVLALLASAGLFSLFLLLLGKSPATFFDWSGAAASARPSRCRTRSSARHRWS